MPGRLTVDLITLFSPIHTSHPATEDVTGAGPSAVSHDQHIVLFETRLSVEYGLTDGVALGLMLPIRVIDSRIQYLDAASQKAVQLSRPNIHHRNETVAGVADPWLYEHLSMAIGRLVLDGRVGLSIPIGSTVPDPFLLGDQGLPHEHIQLGTGTIMPLFSLAAQTGGAIGKAKWRAGVWGFAQLSLYANGYGYQSGHRLAGGAYFASSLWLEKWDFQAGIEAQGETAERWQELVHLDEGNQGRVDLLETQTVSVRLPRDLSIALSIKVPVYTRVTGGQVDYPFIATLGFGGAFDLIKQKAHSHADEDADEDAHDHAHGHAHGDDHDRMEHQAANSKANGEAVYTCPMHPEVHLHAPGRCPVCGMPLVLQSKMEEKGDWTGLDMIEVGEAGKVSKLSPVPGRITVFDFWAPWCVPCRALDVRLSKVARRAGARLSVRKVDVVDWDSAATARFLTPGKFNLPHIKVFGADGRLLFEKSDSPEALAKAVEDVL